MASSELANPIRQKLGLCFDCCFVRRIESARGSVFHRCDRARHDERYPVYPELPCRLCSGYEPAEFDAPSDEV